MARSKRSRKPPSLVFRKRQRKAALWEELQPWLERYRRLSAYIMPFSGRWVASDANKGESGYNRIYDSTATDALKTTIAGLHQRASSPSSEWMVLQTPDPDLNRWPRVRKWLQRHSARMLRIFARSNTYWAFPKYYEEMALYGTGCGFIKPHPKRVIHHYPFTAGQYALAIDGEEAVNVMYRELSMTVAQMVEMFGPERVSESVLSAYENHKFEERRTICHAVEPRSQAERIPGSRIGKHKPWSSCYFEYSSDGKGDGRLPDHPLRLSGFDRFPVLAPRWNVSGGDTYGNGPGMQVLGDVIALQEQTKRKGQAIDYQSNPPTYGRVKFEEVDKRPGGHTELDGADDRIETTYDGRYFNLADLQVDLQEMRERINRGMMAFVFLLQSQNPQDITAFQSQLIEQEKLTLLGPAGERIENGLLRPTIDITFDAMLQMGQVEPWPDEMRDMELGVDFLSPLAQAQKAVGATTADRVEAKARSMMDFWPEVRHVLDAKEHFKRYVEMVGGEAADIRPDEEVRTLEQRDAEAQQAAARMEVAERAAAAGKSAAEIDQMVGAQ